MSRDNLSHVVANEEKKAPELSLRDILNAELSNARIEIERIYKDLVRPSDQNKPGVDDPAPPLSGRNPP